MTLLRAVARTMLASYFVSSGIKAIRDPESLVPAAEPLVDRVVPLVKEYTPEQVASFLCPKITATLVRINGAFAQLFGGVALATGKGRRLGALLLAGSLVPSTIAKHPFWTVQDPEERAQDRSHFLKNVSLLGGVLLAAQDTEARPSLAYRAHKGGEALAKDARKASRKLTKGSSRAADTAGELADHRGRGWCGAARALSLRPHGRCASRRRSSWKEAKAVAAKRAEEAQRGRGQGCQRGQEGSEEAGARSYPRRPRSSARTSELGGN